MLKDEIEKARSQGWQSAVVVGEYLLTRDDVDTNKEGKSLTQCMDYITSEAKKKAKRGSCCMSDEEVFGIAVHYYDEANLKVPKVKGVSSYAPAIDESSEVKKLKEQVSNLKRLVQTKEDLIFQRTQQLNDAENIISELKTKEERTDSPKKESKPNKKKAKPVEERYVQETLF